MKTLFLVLFVTFSVYAQPGDPSGDPDKQDTTKVSITPPPVIKPKEVRVIVENKRVRVVYYVRQDKRKWLYR